MALHMKVNGKFGRRPISRLDDPERVRKDLESQRRITRLQQVRVTSNQVARTIREKVATEKKLQLKKLEQVRQKELDAWRENVLAKKHQDYRSAVFQVGAAHRAAREENERTEQERLEKIEKIKNCRKQAAKRSLKGKTSVQIVATTGGNLNMDGRATAGTQTPILRAENKENRMFGGCEKPGCKGRQQDESKRKRCCCATSGEEESSEDDDDSSILQSQSPTSNSRLQKTPPIILDVEDDDSLSETGNEGRGLEINDRFMQTNRKFSHVVRPNQDEGPEKAETQRRPRFTLITDLVRRTETMTSIRTDPVREREPEVAEAAPPSPKKTVIQVEAALPAATATIATKSTTRTVMGSPKKSSLASRQPQPAKRVGLKTNPPPAKVIDPGILRNQRGKTQATLPRVNAVVEESSSSTRPAPEQEPLRNLQPIPQQANFQQHMPVMPNPAMPQAYPHPQAQPYMHMYPPQPYAVPYSMPYPMPGQCPPPQAMYHQQMMTQQQPVQVSAVTAAPSAATQSTVSATSSAVQRGPKNGGGRVQFYDHSNKYHRTYEAPTQSVQCNERDAGQLSAMDHARIENQLRDLREQELDKLRKISNERGQMALEREQVRRDCAELTDKLDAMTQQEPQLLPSDANFIASHRYADVAARREQKMNEAMEQMLLRPAIITCPEVGTKKPGPSTSPRSKHSAPVSVNLGEHPVTRNNRNGMGSTESCCSILLDYADDQSKQLRSDIKAQESNSLKSERLRGLLERIENIRGHLIEELKAGEGLGSNGDNAQKLIDTIRQERADILAERTKTLNERESELQQKEAILDKRLKSFYKEVKGKKSSDEGEGKPASKLDQPLEIIIKVRSDGTVKQYVPRGKSKPKAKVTTFANGKEASTGSSESTPREEPDKPQEERTSTSRKSAPQDQRQSSFDSNSTAYRSLPPVSYKSFNPATGSEATPSSAPAPAPLDPLIAKYIDRLLSMTRQNIDEIGVSTSDLTTPSPSIINTSKNITPSYEEKAERADLAMLNEQRMERVQTFIAENRSFVNDLEHSIRCQQQLEKEQRAQDIESSFDKIWNKRLAQSQEELLKKNKEREGDLQKKNKERERKLLEGSKRVTPQDDGKPTTSKGKQGTETRVQYEKETRVKQQIQAPSTSKGLSVTQKSTTKTTSETSSTRNMDRFEELTENCTARIAELTDLITKVREEKQRLVEVTLTSNSDGERQSTEYFELPTGSQKQARCRTLSDRSDSISEGLPLQKHKPTAASRDSGIADSRPLTAQGQVNVDVEPISLASSTRSRNKAPPATIRRYSPQLDEEDLGHELSTITEVETPGQSHIVPATPVPRPFPSFDQYARELHLDLAQMDADESLKLQSDFNALVKVVHQHAGGADYREFPSIHAYLHNITTTQIHMEIGGDRDKATLTPAELVRQLRVVNMQMREFPKRKDYMQKLVSQQPADQRELIDSVSLEQDSSDSLDVEEELRQRRILKNSFRRGNLTETTLTGPEVASSTRRESVAPDTNGAPNESGIDPLSGSNYSTDVDQRDRDPCRHAKTQQRKHRSLESSLASTSPERNPRKSRLRGGQSHSHRSHDESDMQDASQLGTSLNLREFLTRELLKHREHPGDTTTESSDDSLRGHFLKSVIHSFSHSSNRLTPAVGVSHATGATNDRQKTSTPVGSFASLANKSGSIQSTGSALFSGESHLSLVHYPDGTPPIPYEQQSKQSTKHNISPSQKTTNEKHRKSPRK